MEPVMNNHFNNPSMNMDDNRGKGAENWPSGWNMERASRKFLTSLQSVVTLYSLSVRLCLMLQQPARKPCKFTICFFLQFSLRSRGTHHYVQVWSRDASPTVCFSGLLSLHDYTWPVVTSWHLLALLLISRITKRKQGWFRWPGAYSWALMSLLAGLKTTVFFSMRTTSRGQGGWKKTAKLISVKVIA